MRKGRFSCYLLGFVALAGLAREYEGTSRNQLHRNRFRGVCLGEPSTVGQSRTKNCQPWLDAATRKGTIYTAGIGPTFPALLLKPVDMHICCICSLQKMFGFRTPVARSVSSQHALKPAGRRSKASSEGNCGEEAALSTDAIEISLAATAQDRCWG